MAVRTTSRKDYAAIGKAKITRPSEMGKKPPRILVYGRNKKGKTRLCTTPGADEVLIADPEQGTARMNRLNPHVWPIEAWDDIDDLYKFCKHEKHSFSWVALDGLTRMHNMALRWVMNQSEERSLDGKPAQVDKRFYGQANEMLKGMMWNFHNLNMGVIFTAQERQEAGYEGEEDEDSAAPAAAYVPDLPKGSRSTVNQIVDVIGRIYVVKASVKVKRNGVVSEEMRPQRRLWIGSSDQYDTGYRSDHQLPDYIKNPTIPVLMELIETGKVTK